MPAKPRIFIGSSKEAEPVAQDIAQALERLGAQGVGWWRPDVFPAGEPVLLSLESIANKVDGAILVATQDDRSVIRGKQHFTPRDNVVYETGLFGGKLGHSRSIIVTIGEPKLPSDLLGVVYVPLEASESYPREDREDFREHARNKLSEWIETIRKQREHREQTQIQTLAPDTPRSPIDDYVQILPQRNYIRPKFEQSIFGVTRRLWVCGIALGGFLEEWKDLLREKVREGLDIRMLALQPRQDIVSMRLKDASYSMLAWRDFELGITGKNEGRGRRLEEWVYNENSTLRKIGNPNRIRFKYYSSFPVGAILLADDLLFYSPTLAEIENQVNPTLVVRKQARSHERFERHFLRIWNHAWLTSDALDDFLLGADTAYLANLQSQTRKFYMEPVDSLLSRQESFVEHARSKLLYNELAPFFCLAAVRNTGREVSFLSSLLSYVPNSAPRFLDLGCGVGRHSNRLATSTVSVTAIDLSSIEIELAKREQVPNTSFHVADMRYWRAAEQADIAICMWSTFSYLSLPDDQQSFFASCHANLADNGILVIDIKNSHNYPTNSYTRTAYSFPFEVKRVTKKQVIQDVLEATYSYTITDVRNGQRLRVTDQEIAKIFTLDDLKRAAHPLFSVESAWGDYDVSIPYAENESERLIVLLRKST